MFSLTYEWMVMIFSVIVFGLIYSFFMLSIQSRIKAKKKFAEAKVPEEFKIYDEILKQRKDVDTLVKKLRDKIEKIEFEQKEKDTYK